MPRDKNSTFAIAVHPAFAARHFTREIATRSSQQSLQSGGLGYTLALGKGGETRLVPSNAPGYPLTVVVKWLEGAGNISIPARNQQCSPTGYPKSGGRDTQWENAAGILNGRMWLRVARYSKDHTDNVVRRHDNELPNDVEVDPELCA
jgi:hypothetical protein